MDSGGVWVENPNPEWQALLESYATSKGSTVSEAFDENGFAVGSDYKIKLYNTAQGMWVEEGHYLRAGYMSGKTSKTVSYEGYGSFTIYSPRVSNVSFDKATGVHKITPENIDKVTFRWNDDNYSYACDRNGEVHMIGRNREWKTIPDSK